MSSENPTKSNSQKKNAFLESFKSTLGNISQACDKVGIDRSTYYDWLEKDTDFKNAVQATNERSIDFAESSLFRLIKEGNVTATIFYLKTRGKHRGYVERTELTGKDGEKLVERELNLAEAKAFFKKLNESL